MATPQTEESLSKALGRTHLLYAQYVHRLHGRSGHFWQNRFYSCPLDQAHAHNAAAYIELNPVRAGLVAHAWTYVWSSAGAHCGETGDPSGALALGTWFSQMPVRAWKATLAAIDDADDAVERLRMHTRIGRPLGDDTFLGKVEALLGRRVRPLPVGRPQGWRKKETDREPESDRQD